jgi:hypothetical protein
LFRILTKPRLIQQIHLAAVRYILLVFYLGGESGMCESKMRRVVINAAFSDAYDGLIRLVGDAQRFGLELRALTLSAPAGKPAIAELTLFIPVSLSADLLVSRLARHPAVLSVEADRMPPAQGAMPEAMETHTFV